MKNYATQNELTLGLQHSCISVEGYNFEDAIVISER